ncbi:MAG: glycoside hydrolase family 3 C-terminal domain-containing protein, partial [Candidatus Nanopelagicales bacterium]
RLFGVHASESRWLLTEVLRDEWGFAGLVVSDWDAVHHRVRALLAGLDLEMPGTGGRTVGEIVAAVEGGELDVAVVDQAALRVLQLVARAHSGTPGRAGGQRAAATAAPPDADHHALAREAAAGAITLLRNQSRGVTGPTLPLSESETGRIAVIGSFAEHPRIQGGGSAGVSPTRLECALEAIRRLAGDRVEYAPGYPHHPLNPYQDDVRAILEGFGQPDPQVPLGSAEVLVPDLRLAAAAGRIAAVTISEDAEQLISAALSTARDAEVIVAFLGLPLAFEQEANDRVTLALPADQRELIARLADLRENTGAALVVVLSNGSAITMEPWHDRVDAIVESWLPGQAGGLAVADVLFGRVNPSGKTAETFPLALQDTPGYLTWAGERGQVLYGESVFIGYRWYDALDRSVRYPFGHGLSYTRFEYSDLRVEVSDEASARVRVTCTVTNSGDRRGQEVVQLYVGDPQAAVRRPVRELRGFAKLALAPGESASVVFELGNRDFAYWDVGAVRPDGRAGGWRREGGLFVIEVAASSRDIRLAQSCSLPDDPLLSPLTPDEELTCPPLSPLAPGSGWAAN